VIVNAGQGKAIHFYTLSLTPTDLLFAWPPGSVEVDDELVKSLVLAHCVVRFSQSAHIYSRDPLENGVPVQMRFMAENVLPKLSWRKK
jgi:hypothetical protein